LIALTLALPAPLLAQSADTAAPAATPSPAATPDATKDDADKLICKREKTLGSRIATGKTCLTRREWQARANAAREQMETRNRATGDS
jgi:hypothetical protein